MTERPSPYDLSAIARWMKHRRERKTDYRPRKVNPYDLAAVAQASRLPLAEKPKESESSSEITPLVK